MFNSILLELYPELADDDAQYACVEEHYRLTPQMPLTQLRSIIEAHYGWALQFDFDDADANHYFWYRSEDKMEPRIGERYSEPGADKEMPLLIARLVRDCYDRLLADIEQHSAIQSTAYFLLRQPDLRWIVKRIQAMSQECYGEIRANLADKEMLPLDLLRCKLAFFGVSKFDPKSKLWVRNTMFQGAPVVSDIGCERVSPFLDDWCFPVTSDQHA